MNVKDFHIIIHTIVAQQILYLKIGEGPAEDVGKLIIELEQEEMVWQIVRFFAGNVTAILGHLGGDVGQLWKIICFYNMSKWQFCIKFDY